MLAHPCWELDEIVSAIAVKLVLNEAKASAVALARCSSSLEEPVLCEVWRSLSSLAPLVKCFPPEIWEMEDGQLVFTRAPFRIEWTRFQERYAPKVRHLVVSSPDAVISTAALQMLQLYSQCSPLLPNLVSISWVNNDVHLPFITSFFSHSLTSISIDVPTSAGRILPPILTRLSTMAPDIGKIVVQRLKNEPVMEEASSQLLMRCNPHRLRKYNVDATLSASALSHMVQLPLLTEFWLVGPFHFPDPLPDVVFPSLQSLFVEFDGDPSWLNLLPAIESPVLSGIYIECPGSDVAHFMETFELITTGCGMHDRFQELKVLCENGLEITPQLIARTFSFKNLTTLTFASMCCNPCQSMGLTDDDIDLLTNAIPGLEYLIIGGRPCKVPSKITFNSLYTISRRCTRLTTLQIHFNPNSFVQKVNANPDPRNVNFETPSSDLCSVTRIDVGNIALPRQSQVSYIMALGLLGVFPRLEGVEYHEVAWKEVNSLIAFFRRIHTAFVKR